MVSIESIKRIANGVFGQISRMKIAADNTVLIKIKEFKNSAKTNEAKLQILDEIANSAFGVSAKSFYTEYYDKIKNFMKYLRNSIIDNEEEDENFKSEVEGQVDYIESQIETQIDPKIKEILNSRIIKFPKAQEVLQKFFFDNEGNVFGPSEIKTRFDQLKSDKAKDFIVTKFKEILPQAVVDYKKNQEMMAEQESIESGKGTKFNQQDNALDFDTYPGLSNLLDKFNKVNFREMPEEHQKAYGALFNKFLKDGNVERLTERLWKLYFIVQDRKDAFDKTMPFFKDEINKLFKKHLAPSMSSINDKGLNNFKMMERRKNDYRKNGKDAIEARNYLDSYLANPTKSNGEIVGELLKEIDARSPQAITNLKNDRKYEKAISDLLEAPNPGPSDKSALSNPHIDNSDEENLDETRQEFKKEKTESIEELSKEYKGLLNDELEKIKGWTDEELNGIKVKFDKEKYDYHNGAAKALDNHVKVRENLKILRQKYERLLDRASKEGKDVKEIESDIEIIDEKLEKLKSQFIPVPGDEEASLQKVDDPETKAKLKQYHAKYHSIEGEFEKISGKFKEIPYNIIDRKTKEEFFKQLRFAFKRCEDAIYLKDSETFDDKAIDDSFAVLNDCVDACNVYIEAFETGELEKYTKTATIVALKKKLKEIKARAHEDYAVKAVEILISSVENMVKSNTEELKQKLKIKPEGHPQISSEEFKKALPENKVLSLLGKENGAETLMAEFRKAFDLDDSKGLYELISDNYGDAVNTTYERGDEAVKALIEKNSEMIGNEAV